MWSLLTSQRGLSGRGSIARMRMIAGTTAMAMRQCHVNDGGTKKLTIEADRMPTPMAMLNIVT